MSQVNLQLLAKELGLSIATISKALRDSHEISIETKNTVLALAKKLNYTPNPYASSLRRKRSNTIAVIIPEVADSFFSLAIKGIEEVAKTKGYHVLIYLTYESYEREKKILDECKNGRVDGVLLSVASGTTNYDHIQELASFNIPLVLFDRVLDKLPVSKVATNDYESSFMATQHLLQAGCIKPVYLSVTDTNLMEMNNRRMQGFTAALEEAGVIPNQDYIVHCNNDIEATQLLVQEVLTATTRPDGILASVEHLAIPVYKCCKQLGITIPLDVKIVCFSTSPYASVLQPGLTTITQPAKDIGNTAATLLFKALGKKNGQILIENITLSSSLVVRESTAITV